MAEKMKLVYRSNNLPVALRITVRAAAPIKIFLKVEDYFRPNSKYTDRYKTIQGTESFLVKMPLSPEIVKITVVNEKGNDYGFSLVSKAAEPLQTRMTVFDFGNPGIAKFILFSQQFAQRAGYLSPGQYYNKTGEYMISFVDQIKAHDTGRILNTPARISSGSGLVEASKAKFDKFTIPGRVATLLHEFCHVFKNKDIESEAEADKHAATIYLALGFPTVDLINVFSDIFYKADNDLNRKRINLLTQYALEFENNIFNVQYK
jgi:hypothetical protein